MTDLQDKNNAHMDADVAKDGDSVSVLNFVEVQSNAGDKTFNKDDNAAEKPFDKDVSGPALTDSAAEKLFDKDDSGPALTDIESDGIVKDLSMGANLDSEENEQEKEEEDASDKNEKDDHDDKDDKDDGDAGGNAGCNTGGKADDGGAIERGR
ncbi:uncharacterized protein LOC126669850 isoform X1 [Mercurialis annua]|uniref:uncharacterized protein LOC126669850 isoform X1 n=1 Tax=Mercurialis annua TaxID=3986 RepID=UPI00215E42AD|nr:uncharacterized protein LOC126669850 isoform X1 [Mercurialis annua]